MIKNTSGQKVGVQMVSATDGSAFTGSVTVAVTVDAGTQATGSVGSGACTHEGNGYHTYAPSQAETNGDLVAFTFTGTGAVPQTVQVYTRASAPDVNVSTIANNAITAAAIATDAIGAAELAADAVTEIQSGLATASALSTVAGYVDTEVAAIKAKTDNLPASPAATTDIPSASTIAAAVWDRLTSALTTSGSIGKLLVDNVNATISSRLASASYTAPLDAAGTRTAVGLASANLDTQLDALPTASENATALLDASDGIETGYTLRQAFRIVLALAGKLSGAATSTNTFRNPPDTKDRIVATVDADGNRTAVTFDVS